MIDFKELYTPIEPTTEAELKAWILAHRKSPANNGTESERIISKHFSKIPEIHDSRYNPLLRTGFSGPGRLGGRGRSYWWIGLKTSDKMFCVSYEID